MVIVSNTGGNTVVEQEREAWLHMKNRPSFKGNWIAIAKIVT